jgi:undecaprenyl-diphosphatase
MFETLNHIDHQFFLAINNGLQNSFFDWLCPILRNQKVWYPLYAVLIYFIYKKYKEQILWIVIGAAILILISDQVSANLIKNLVQRIRPCNDPSFQNQVHLLVICGNGFSFISAHATNHFAIAFYMIGFFETQRKWFAPTAIIWAASIAFSQV